MNRQHLEQLKRPDLQTLAKRNNIRATQKNEVLIDELLKIEMPSITGVKALEQVMGLAAMKQQKVMMRSGLCPRGPARDRVIKKAAVPERENTQRPRKSKSAMGKGDEAATAMAGAVASESTPAAGSESHAERPEATRRGKRTPGKKRVQRSTAMESHAESSQVSSPAVKKGKARGRARVERANSMKPKEDISGTATSDDELREEEEVEAMTSLDNIIVDLASSPVRPARAGRENKKRGAEDDVCESPRPAKRARTSSVL